MNAKPFVKWAGGKGQLMGELGKRLPSEILQDGVIPRYVEPFVGGGAMFFHLQGRYEIRESYLSDNNADLILTYEVIKKDAQRLIDELLEIESFHLQKSEDERKENYYRIREAYNSQKIDHQTMSQEWIERAAYFIFLNKTCFNGLYRLNSKGLFNVPFGRYKNPTICDGKNLKAVQDYLKDTNLFQGDFTDSKEYINEESFVYLDPPYRPLNHTSHFTNYSKEGFNDDSQKKLANFFKETDEKGAKLMLSNSDPKNQDEGDKFFDELYSDFNLERIPAKRNINRDASRRGKINELIVRNYH
ncbi:MAG: DNA adenine methylase [Methanobacterium sp.]